MTGLWVAVLLGTGAVVLMPASGAPMLHSRTPLRPRRSPGGGGFLPARLQRSRPDPVQDLPLLIHQLTGLLAAGRAPHLLWADAAALQARSTSPSRTALAERLLPVLDAAAQAAALGLSPVPVFLAAARDDAGDGDTRFRKTRPKTGSGAIMSVARLWTELAACIAVSERSGAALAGVLNRYAVQLEGGLDSSAARETALAGPQATVRLLTWLPVGGLCLGYLLGADPLGVLLGSPAGWLAGAAGAVLSLAGRLWSRSLVRQAAGT